MAPSLASPAAGTPAFDLPLLSASQINKFDGCERQWGFRYILNIPDPSGPAAELGKEVDDTQLQPYLKEGRPFDFTRESGYIAASALAYLPQPKHPGLEVQKHFVMPSPSGRFAYQGYLDLWLPKGGLPGIDDGGTQIADFKTTGDLKWAKTELQLAVDTQAQLYATWAMWSTGTRSVDLAWIYMQTKNARRVKRVHIRVDGDHVGGQFAAIDKRAQRIVDAKRSVTDPLELPPNPEMCSAYGGCPYRAKCNLSPAQIIDSVASRQVRQPQEQPLVNSSSLLANLKAKKNGAPPAPSPPTPTFAGVNPPEKELPPAAPVGTVEEKPKRGRPKKDAAEPAPEVGQGETACITTTFDETFEVTYGREYYQPTQFNGYEVGPFKATGTVLPGESRGDAYRRVYQTLSLFAIEARADKAAAFKRAMGGV